MDEQTNCIDGAVTARGLTGSGAESLLGSIASARRRCSSFGASAVASRIRAMASAGRNTERGAARIRYATTDVLTISRAAPPWRAVILTALISSTFGGLAVYLLAGRWAGPRSSISVKQLALNVPTSIELVAENKQGVAISPGRPRRTVSSLRNFGAPARPRA
jgi:hypothetical protein